MTEIAAEITPTAPAPIVVTVSAHAIKFFDNAAYERHKNTFLDVAKNGSVNAFDSLIGGIELLGHAKLSDSKRAAALSIEWGDTQNQDGNTDVTDAERLRTEYLNNKKIVVRLMKERGFLGRLLKPLAKYPDAAEVIDID